MARSSGRLAHDAEYQRIIDLSLRDPAGLLKRAQTARCSHPGGLFRFVKLMWRFVEPARDFVETWHIHAICDHLEAVTRGEIPRLLINVPPGFMKSLLSNVFWPAW